jgi:glucokinase
VTKRAVLGVDVGGTSIKARLVDSDGLVAGDWRRQTPAGDASGERTVSIVAELLATARAEAVVDAIGVVVPGIVDETSGVCIRAVNLGWNDLAIRDILGSRLGLPLAFGQDVRAGALAESTSGAAVGTTGTVAFVPVGTGLASALIVDGRPVSSGGWAGEIGQLVITHGEAEGRRVEEIASAGGIARAAGLPTARAVADAVRAGDATATAVWNLAVEVLAEAVAWIGAVAGPELVIVGGGLAGAGDLLFLPLRAGVEARTRNTRSPAIRPAVHGDSAAAIGAAQLAARLLDPGVSR